MKNFNSDAKNKDVITVDYMVTGGRQKDFIWILKNHSVKLTFSFPYPLYSSAVFSVIIAIIFIKACKPKL